MLLRVNVAIIFNRFCSLVGAIVSRKKFVEILVLVLYLMDQRPFILVDKFELFIDRRTHLFENVFDILHFSCFRLLLALFHESVQEWEQLNTFFVAQRLLFFDSDFGLLDLSFCKASSYGLDVGL